MTVIKDSPFIYEIAKIEITCPNNTNLSPSSRLCTWKTTDFSKLEDHDLNCCILKCSICGKRQKDLVDLKKHLILVHLIRGEKPWFQCPFCPFFNKYELNVYHHTVEHHGIEESDPENMINMANLKLSSPRIISIENFFKRRSLIYDEIKDIKTLKDLNENTPKNVKASKRRKSCI